MCTSYIKIKYVMDTRMEGKRKGKGREGEGNSGRKEGEEKRRGRE